LGPTVITVGPNLSGTASATGMDVAAAGHEVIVTVVSARGCSSRDP
jgi:hypothetical protein